MFRQRSFNQVVQQAIAGILFNLAVPQTRLILRKPIGERLHVFSAKLSYGFFNFFKL